ncbi:MAG: nuclease, partial [Lentisphaerae bacterium]
RNKPYPDVKVSRLLKVIDGDTFRCDIDEHSAIAGKNISIRLRGINTPELRSRNKEERRSAQLEKQRLSDLLHNARVIELRNIGRDKYFRIDADVYIDGEPLLPKLNRQYLTRGK